MRQKTTKKMKSPLSDVQPNISIRSIVSRLTGGLPEDKNFVSSADALFDQMEEQDHFSRILQDAGLISAHDLLRLDVKRQTDTNVK